MIRIAYFIFFASCFAYSSADEQKPEEVTPPPSKDGGPSRLLTDVGYFRYGDPFYVYPSPAERRLQYETQKNPTDTNELDTSNEERNRPLFIFTTYETRQRSPQRLSNSPYIEIRKKRETDLEIPESSKVGKLRRKRTYCRKCGGGYGGYTAYIPVTYIAYPVYYGGNYGGNKGCHTCGGGGGGGGGGFGGSYSYSSSSSHSSSGSFGWGK